ncbi:CocE/NonD family hydrolase [Actinopolymorpha alba]|uniref:CocE/NonD family hydrolase n=1 Tax=Actinopolymorpha alba TaxID=533267 RepID=UPI000370A529|nr:CocE/NonD family hydrolase [Actinopolymorpha alba]
MTTTDLPAGGAPSPGVLTGLDVTHRPGVPMRTRDGVTLVADLWHPEGAGPWPALLVRTPYGRTLASAITSPHPSVLARRGYLVVTQDVRGRGDSAGEFVPFAHEANDGEDAIGWVAGLPECDGRVGTYGFSYQGCAQLLAAANKPRALRAIAPAMCSADPAEGFLFHAGILRLGYAVSWGSQLSGADGFLGPAAAGVLAARIAAEDVPDWAYWQDWTEGRCGPVADLRAVEVPALVTIGWYDTFAGGGARDLAALSDNGYLLGAPWAHMPWSPDSDVAFETHLAFFDQHVAGRPGPRLPRARSLAVDGGWQDLPAWPPAPTRQRFYLTSDGNAATRWGDGCLAPQPRTGAPVVATYEPAVPVPSLGGAANGNVGRVGRVDQGPVQDRTDVLVYTSEPLTEPLEIAGTPTAHLALSSTAPTHDGCVTLCSVAPDGSCGNLAFGAARGTGDLEVELAPVHAIVPAGHRLRVAVAPSAFPELSPNRSSGWHQVVRVLRSGSWVELPVRT